MHAEWERKRKRERKALEIVDDISNANVRLPRKEKERNALVILKG